MISFAGILLIILVLGLVWCITKHNIVQGFVGNMAAIIHDSNCPDYIATDGSQYYLLFNHKEFDGINNPLIFKTLVEARIEMRKRGCPDAERLEPIYLRRQTNRVDPSESYERVCAKQVANPLYWLNSCAFDIAYDKSDDTELMPGGGGKNKPTAPVNNGKALTNDKYKLLRQLNDFLNSQDTNTQVNYDIETCMIDKLGKEMPELGGTDKLQKFNKYFNVALTGATTDNKLAGQDQVANLDEQALAEFNTYFNDANELAIPQHMLDKIFTNSTI